MGARSVRSWRAGSRRAWCFATSTARPFMDIRPINPGDVLVVPNRHATFLSELAEDAGVRVFGVGQRVAAALYGSNLRC